MCIRDSICADGLTGIKEAIAAAYPKTEYQRCIVHQVRNTMKYVSDKDRKPFCADLKTIYHAATEEKALEALELSLIHIFRLRIFPQRHISGGYDS